jgi:hypothetical protein
MAARLLSKSRYMNGLQCLKYLWLIFHEPDQIRAPDASTQHIFDQGHLVGDLAKKLFPEGIEVPNESFMGNVKSTRELLSRRRPLFEAGFMVNGLFSRVDILNPSGKDAWDIIEVKSSTSVKDENLQDVAFQKLCCQKQGLEIRKCYLCFINSHYLKHGEIDPTQLFKIEDITEEVEEGSEGIEESTAIMLEVMASAKCPESLVGPNCREPYACPVTSCWQELPENNILSLYRGGKKAFEMFNKGILFMKDIPEGVKLSKAQEIQKACDISGGAYAEKEAIHKFLAALENPLQFLDFETFAPAIPLFDGTRPYQKIPFQYSLHVEEKQGELLHYSFLANGPGDPRPELLRQLKNEIRPFGSILTYNQSFEQGVLEELGRTFPEYAAWIGEVVPRLSDLIIPFRNFHYYHPAQEGSASIKHVLPALVGQSYAGMNIAGGDAASRTYLDMTYGNLGQAEKAQIRADLEKYCGLDTEAMVLIVKKLDQIGA